jgi:putative two-component system response regulator
MPSPLNTAAKGAKVLVVDDEPHIRRILARWLTEAGYRCDQAADGSELWAYLQTNTAELVTLDVNMPGQNGLELLPQIKQLTPDTEVIMLTARGEANTVIDALTHGAYGYLLKPVERDEFLFQTRKALERRELLIERRAYTKQLEERVRQQTVAIRHAHEETILRLVCASQYRDEETGAHIRRTGLHSELMASVLGWPADRIETIRMAAPMHDVGKIGVPDAILRKPAKLTEAEFEIMKTHTTIGAAMLEGSESAILQMGREIALCHHERWDGRGYPRGLSGADIPESARILALVDVYDALSHDRVYRKAMPEDEVLALMEKGAGSHFDPSLYSVLSAILPELRRISAANPDAAEAAPATNPLAATRPAAPATEVLEPQMAGLDVTG